MRPVPARRAGALGVLALLLAAGCSRDTPVAPVRTVSGPVVLVGYLTNAAGRFLGTRVFADADGVPVELVTGTRVVATTTTLGGRYTFADVPNGAYLVRSRIAYDLNAVTRPVTVADAPVEVSDTLRLGSFGDLYPWPNPFSDTLSTSFEIPVREQASLRVLDARGNTVRVLLEGMFNVGTNMMPWNGTDAAGFPLPSGFYWLMLVEPGASRAQLIFRR